MASIETDRVARTRAAILASKRSDGGMFLTDDEIRDKQQWQWTSEDKKLVRALLDAVPHDVDCSWAPAGGVYITVHRNGVSILTLEAGYIHVMQHKAPDAYDWLTTHAPYPPYQSPTDAQQNWKFTLPSGSGQLMSGAAPSRRQMPETGMCPTCGMYPLTAVGECSGGVCDE